MFISEKPTEANLEFTNGLLGGHILCQHVPTMGIIRVEADIWDSTEFAKTFERVFWGPSEQRHFKVVVQFLKRHPCNTTCADWCSKSAGLHCFSPSVIDFIWLFERAGK